MRLCGHLGYGDIMVVNKMKTYLPLLVMIFATIEIGTATIVSTINETHALTTTNKLLFPKSLFPESDVYKKGWSDGFLGQPFKGQHTRDYIYGYLNGTSTYVYNYNETGGGHNLDWYIGFHNGAAVADDQYANGGNFDSSGGCLGGQGKDYCLGYKMGYDLDANALG
jgi:hypothetical protein